MLDAEILRRLVEGGQLITVRRGDRLTGPQLPAGLPLVVISGLAAIESHLDSERRQVHAFAFPREIICLDPFEAMPDLAVTAIVECRICRPRASLFTANGETAADEESSRLAAALLSARLAFLNRQALHAATLGRLSGEERVATLLLELALANGRRRGDEIVFDLAMTRTDMADYLDLNADTLSRVLTRLRSVRALSLDGRSGARTTELSMLEQLTPLAGAVRRARPRVL